ncbi:DUF4149 domain-containing protein [Caldimonas sp. KR1-144]|uniref:DUF4149 domain-containing protein n=1 Tax=Caldimonas sp. KR1-144 TaxID=3400911 RepID=UPI003C082412
MAMPVAQTWSRLLAAAWLGALLAVALIGTPAPFALLARAEAGEVAGRMLAHEATLSLLLGVVVAMIERHRARQRAVAGQGSQFSAGMALALGALFCTVLGYYALQPMMAEARAGLGRFGFAQLHAVSTAFYGLKVVLVAVLAWRAASSPD